MPESWVPYCGAAPVPGDWLLRWNGDPILLASLVLLVAVMLRQADRPLPGLLGVVLLAILFVTPLCALSSALFAARVGHHVVLTAIAAPLLAAALPVRRHPTIMAPPIMWTAAHAVVFWLWHAPQPYALALQSDAAYWLMQLSLLGTAIGFWLGLRQVSALSRIGLLLLMMVQMGLLGALLTFAAAPLHAAHWWTTQAWGLTPLEDQQLGGLIMWAPASLFYLGAALMILWHLLAPTRPAPA